MKDCYSVTQYSVQHILKLITSGDIAIPEIIRRVGVVPVVSGKLV